MDYFCYSNKIISLKGVPDVIHGDFNCSDNKLISLKDGPIKIEGTFDCTENSLETMEWKPEEVSGTTYADQKSKDNELIRLQHNDLKDVAHALVKNKKSKPRVKI